MSKVKKIFVIIIMWVIMGIFLSIPVKLLYNECMYSYEHGIDIALEDTQMVYGKQAFLETFYLYVVYYYPFIIIWIIIVITLIIITVIMMIKR